MRKSTFAVKLQESCFIKLISVILFYRLLAKYFNMILNVQICIFWLTESRKTVQNK